MKYHYFLAVCVLAFLPFLLSCDRSDPDPDHCKDAVPFEAEFYIEEAVGDSLVITDNVLEYAYVTFESVDLYDSYEWQVENPDNTSTNKKYTLLFPFTEQDIEVRLIATKKASPCFPNDKTVDTVYHTFSVVPWRDAAIIGKYVGSYSRTPTLKDTVEIRYTTTEDNPDPYGEYLIININRGCNVEKYPHQACPGGTRGYRAFSIKTDLCKKCPSTNGLLRLLDENTVEANITYGDTTKWGNFPLPQLEDKFVGTRIQ